MLAQPSKTRGALLVSLAPVAAAVALAGCASVLVPGLAPDAAPSEFGNVQAAPIQPAPIGPQVIDPDSGVDPFSFRDDQLLDTGLDAGASLEAGAASIPCLNEFENMLVDHGFATWHELSQIPPDLLEQEIAAEAADAGITIDELCTAVTQGASITNHGVLEA